MASRMDEPETRSAAWKWPVLVDKENKEITRQPQHVQGPTMGWGNRAGCKSEKYEHRVLKDSTNISNGCTIPTTRQQSKKPALLVTNAKTKFRVTPGRKSVKRPNRKSKVQANALAKASSPSYVVVKGEQPMEVAEIHEQFTHQCPVKAQSCVRDTVANNKEKLFLCPEYACDIVDYLQEVEARWIFPSDFLEDDSDVTPKMRGILTDWLIQVQNHENLNEESLHLTVAIIDRYISIHKLRLSLLQLLGITCLLIAAKFVERFPPEISTLCKLTDDTYTVTEVLEMEIIVLKTLQFNLNIPTPIIFLRRFIGTQTYTSEEYNLSEYLLDLSLTSHVMVSFPPSVIAASALYLARLVFRTKMIWTPTLAYYTKYVKRDLKHCVALLSKMLSTAECKELQGARTKFSSSKRDVVGNHVILKDNIDIISAAKGILPTE